VLLLCNEKVVRIVQSLVLMMKKNPQMVYTADFDWFHGDMTQNEAEVKLKDMGSNGILVRYSSEPGKFTLSRIVNNEIHHERIEKNSNGYFCISKLLCRTLGFLIRNYIRKNFPGEGIPICNSTRFRWIFDQAPYKYHFSASQNDDYTGQEGGNNEMCDEELLD
jgi:hypothetical protein